MKRAALDVPLIQVADLELTSRGRLELTHSMGDALVVEIKSSDGVVRLRRFRLFDDTQGAVGRIEFDDPVALGIVDPACEYGRATRLPSRVPQQDAQIVAVKDIVAEDQSRWTAGKKFTADQKSFRYSARVVLDRIGKLDAPLSSLAEQPLEFIDLFRGRDDQKIADAGEHQPCHRVVDQGLVVNRQH